MKNHSFSAHHSVLALGLFAAIGVGLAMAILAVAQYPAFFLHPGARVYLFEPIGALVVYAVAIVLVARAHGQCWDAVLKTAIPFGLLTGIFEVLNIGIENGIPFRAAGPGVAIGFMIVVFTLWGAAGFRAARSLGSVGPGLLAAVSSGCICMLIAVAAGFVVQFFVAPPDPAVISIWAEYKRSGWTDARAFGIANTLESAFTHLVVAPLVATVVGGLGTLLVRFKRSNAISIAH